MSIKCYNVEKYVTKYIFSHIVRRDPRVEVTAYAAKDERRQSVFVKFCYFFFFVFLPVGVVLLLLLATVIRLVLLFAAEQKMKCEGREEKKKLSLTYCRNRKSDRSIYIVGVVIVLIDTVDVLEATMVVVYHIHIRYSILGWRIFLHTLDMH